MQCGMQVLYVSHHIFFHIPLSLIHYQQNKPFAIFPPVSIWILNLDKWEELPKDDL